MLEIPYTVQAEKYRRIIGVEVDEKHSNPKTIWLNLHGSVQSVPYYLKNLFREVNNLVITELWGDRGNQEDKLKFIQEGDSFVEEKLTDLSKGDVEQEWRGWRFFIRRIDEKHFQVRLFDNLDQGVLDKRDKFSLIPLPEKK